MRICCFVFFNLKIVVFFIVLSPLKLRLWSKLTGKLADFADFSCCALLFGAIALFTVNLVSFVLQYI